ncbi:hypothetical protein [Mycolicibacter acidiphilus]|nr:hypothetical protein [Mycolicibacter acidiphilus]
MILAGQLRGGVRKHGAAHRWFVHSDELPVDTRVAELTDAPRVAQQLAAQVEINRLLLGAQQNLLDAQAQLLAGDAAAMHYRDAALGYQEAAKKYRDALALTLAPDDVSEILDRT